MNRSPLGLGILASEGLHQRRECRHGITNYRSIQSAAMFELNDKCVQFILLAEKSQCAGRRLLDTRIWN